MALRPSVYFERYAYPDVLFPDFEPPDDLQMVVVIPSFQEEETHLAVQSLLECHAPTGHVIILVVVNEAETVPADVSSTNHETIGSLEKLNTPSWATLKVCHLRFPPKKAGVGLARKAGMDEAARWFDQTQEDGLIVCFDADCQCSSDYFTAIERFFHDTKQKAGIVFFEHPLDHEEIIQYELFLRYYIDALRLAGFPHAYQTLGSCIAVRSSRYQQVGGMSPRQAGEDFYFLHKAIPLGGFGEINDATVYPSPRTSDRVPFGTGHAVQKIQREDEYLVYNPESFLLVREVFATCDHFRENPELSVHPIVDEFHEAHQFTEGIAKAIAHSKDLPGFHKKFLEWWDAFRVLKFMHYCRDHHLPSVPLKEGLQWLNESYWHLPVDGGMAGSQQLQRIRDWDRKYGG